MDIIDEIKSLAHQLWPEATVIDVSPAGGGHTGITGEDPPKRLRFIAAKPGGATIEQFEADTMEDVCDKLQQRIDGTRQRP